MQIDLKKKKKRNQRFGEEGGGKGRFKRNMWI